MSPDGMTPQRLRSVVRLVGVLLLLAALPPTPSDAQPVGEEFVGYESVGSGRAFTTFPSVPALLPFDAPFEATVSLATATLSSGGQGFGRASTFFPGTPIAGLRPLIEIAGAPPTPIPDYPIVIETREFEPAKHNEQPGITMSSDVDSDRAVVIADAGGMAVPGVWSVGSSRTVSTSMVTSGLVSGSSVTTVQGIDVSGLVKIETIRSLATVTTDATSSTCEGGTIVSGVTVAGQPATLDEAGLHLGEQGAPGPDANAADAALAASGITMRVLSGDEACGTPSGSRSTPGVLISVPLPGVGALPPGGAYMMIVASAAASAGASVLPGFDPPAVEPDTVFGGVIPRVPGPSVGGAGLPPVGLPRVEVPDRLSSPTHPLIGADLTGYNFAGVPAVIVLGLVYITIPGARRIRRYMLSVMALVELP